MGNSQIVAQARVESASSPHNNGFEHHNCLGLEAAVAQKRVRDAARRVALEDAARRRCDAEAAHCDNDDDEGGSRCGSDADGSSTCELQDLLTPSEGSGAATPPSAGHTLSRRTSQLRAKLQKRLRNL